VLNELSAAKLTLLATATRAAYDAALRGTTQEVAAATPPGIVSPRFDSPAGDPSLAAQDAAQAGLPVRVGLSEARTAAALDEPGDAHRPAWRQPWFLVLIASLLVAIGGLMIGLKTIVHYRQETAGRSKDAEPPSGQPPWAEDLSADGDLAEEPPILVYPEADGTVNLLANCAQLRGGLELKDCGDYDAITGWTSSTSSAAWRFTVLKPGIYGVRLIYAVTEGAQEGVLEVTIGSDTQPASKVGFRHALSMRGGPGVLIEDENHLAIQRSGENTLLVRSRTPTSDGLMYLRALRLSPPRGTTR
jgi:hypothetical protein